jgi:hypothetical protein
MKKKKLLLSLIIAFTATTSLAQHHNYYGVHTYHGPVVVNRYYGHSGCYGCGIGAAILGGTIIGSALAQSYYAPPPIIVTTPPVVYTTPAVPAGYHWQNMLDSTCNCYRNVLVPN